MEEKEPNQTAPDGEKPARSKNALLRYLTILFAVAFALVLLSYLIQMRNMNTTVSELNKTSSSALSNAERLQDTNQALMAENDALGEQVDALESQVDALQDQLDAATAEAGDAKAAGAQSEARAAELEEALSAQRETYERTLAAYELLARASAACGAGDLAALRESMAALEGQTGFLSAEGVRQYQALVEFMNAPAAESGAETGAE